MSLTQAQNQRGDNNAAVNKFNSSMENGRKALTSTNVADSAGDRDMYLNRAKSYFIVAIRNAQKMSDLDADDPVQNSKSSMLNESVSELCGVMSKALVYNWKDSRQILNLIEVHPYDFTKRQSYRSDREFSMITEIDLGGLTEKNKQDIAKQVCDCIVACIRDYMPSRQVRQQYTIPDTKEIQTLEAIAWRYGLTEYYDLSLQMMLRATESELA